MFDKRPMTPTVFSNSSEKRVAQTQSLKAPVVKAFTPAPVTEIKKPHGTYTITSRKNNHVASYQGLGMQPKPIPGGQKKTLDEAKGAVEAHHADRTAMLHTPIK